MTEHETEIAHPSTSSLPRRTVLRSAAVAGVALPFLAACGSDDESSPASGGDTGSGDGGDPGSGDGGNTGGDGGSTGGDGGTTAEVIATTSEVPEGGGIILDDPGIVITQPEAADFKGFTNTCTHQGCPVANVSDGTINCTCHGSKYSIADGSVVAGPAPSPLAEKAITVDGSDISLA